MGNELSSAGSRASGRPPPPPPPSQDQSQSRESKPETSGGRTQVQQLSQAGPSDGSGSGSSARENGHGSLGSESDVLQGVMNGVKRIHELEEYYRQKAALLAQKRLELEEGKQFAQVHIAEQTEFYKNSLASIENENKEVFGRKMNEAVAAKERELEALIVHVNTRVLSERRAMQSEDAVAFVLREMDSVWREGFSSLQAAHRSEAEQQLAIVRKEYNTKYAEMCANLDAEYVEAQGKAVEARRAQKNKKRGSGGFLDWFSPGKRSRAGGAGEDEEEDDDDSADSD
jgi:hypothetical protein